MPYLLSSEATFSAAHALPGAGDCARFHGHNWRVRVTVRVQEDALDETGIGVDFRDLEEMTRRAVADFEHRFLNEVPPFDTHPPSAERLARVVFDRIVERLDGRSGVGVEQVELWEMPQYRVVYRPQ